MSRVVGEKMSGTEEERDLSGLSGTSVRSAMTGFKFLASVRCWDDLRLRSESDACWGFQPIPTINFFDYMGYADPIEISA